MSERQDLLIELGTEELPPKALKRLSEAFGQEVMRGLEQAGIPAGESRLYATPRRLAILIDEVALKQPDRDIERRGPAVQAAIDADGKPTKAGLGFAGSCGVDFGDIERMKTDKGEWLVYRGSEAGKATAELLPGIVETALNRLPIPKRMRWGAGRAQFVRPVHWLVLLHGDAVVDAEILGVASNRISHGHRFHAPEPISLERADDYLNKLSEQGHVMPDFTERRHQIRLGVESTAETVGGRAVIDDELLDEVTALVEWPVPMVGRFDEEFLEVPPEALISSMQGHQKYFPVRGPKDELLPCFVFVSNIQSREPEAVRHGNERVIRPRLADAKFFWDQDRKQKLADHLEEQKSIVFQKQLGSLYDKSERIATLSAWLADTLGADKSRAERAAWLSKCDLLTEMVGEFPELQGIMGRYYAAHDGEHAEVAAALDQVYWPRFAGDRVAGTATGQIVAIAERVDTLVGIFAIGKAPSGDKDPFALRRAALGLIRTLVENELELDLRALLTQAAAGFGDKVDAAAQVDAVYGFVLERLRGYLLDKGVTAEMFDAVAAIQPTSLLDFVKRVEACREFVAMPESASLAGANKRIRNILRKVEGEVPNRVDQGLFEHDEERALNAAFQEAADDVDPLLSARDYTGALKRMTTLKAPVDAFFDKVLVMAEDDKVKQNRLALLKGVGNLFGGIADISHLPSQD